MAVSQKDLDLWRTGFHAANPEQAKSLVLMLDGVQRRTAATERLRLQNCLCEAVRSKQPSRDPKVDRAWVLALIETVCGRSA